MSASISPPEVATDPPVSVAIDRTRALRRASSGLDGSTIGAAVVVVAGCALLGARPALVAASNHPVALLVALFVALLVAGACWPLPASPAAAPSRTGGSATLRTLAVIVVGVAAFAVGRGVGGGHPPAPASLPFVLAGTLAAVAEEAFFRRLCYGLLLPAGTAWALVGSSVLFAAVHVSTYGIWVLPLDLAAGLVLGWQRSATGTWRASAVTHIVANLLVVL